MGAPLARSLACCAWHLLPSPRMPSVPPPAPAPCRSTPGSHQRPCCRPLLCVPSCSQRAHGHEPRVSALSTLSVFSARHDPFCWDRPAPLPSGLAHRGGPGTLTAHPPRLLATHTACMPRQRKHLAAAIDAKPPSRPDPPPPALFDNASRLQASPLRPTHPCGHSLRVYATLLFIPNRTTRCDRFPSSCERSVARSVLRWRPHPPPPKPPTFFVCTIAHSLPSSSKLLPPPALACSSLRFASSLDGFPSLPALRHARSGTHTRRRAAG